MNVQVNPLAIVQKYADVAPVPIFEILNELGLGPKFEFLDDNISGWIERTPLGRYEVVVNALHPRVRQRFTAAHELGHFIYHRGLLGAGVGDTRAYRAEGTRLPNLAIRPVHERQANSFAANVLMPYPTIFRLRNEGVLSVEDLAERFDVSKDAMRIRLGLPRAA